MWGMNESPLPKLSTQMWDEAIASAIADYSSSEHISTLMKCREDSRAFEESLEKLLKLTAKLLEKPDPADIAWEGHEKDWQRDYNANQ